MRFLFLFLYLRSCSLQALARLKRRYHFLLVVDDAHGSLVLGPHGGGTAEAAGESDAVDVHTGTLSKAFGSLGGFVACSHAMKSFLVNAARAFTYSTALPMPCVAASLAALDVASRCALSDACAPCTILDGFDHCVMERLNNSKAVLRVARRKVSPCYLTAAAKPSNQ
jgi:hypothetical protein